MSNGQGSISFSEPPGSSGGGSFPAIGARDGLTIESDYVVLGNLDTDLTDPAQLIDNRRLQMQDFVLYFAFDSNQAWNLTLNDQSAGGGGNTIPSVWRSPASSYWSSWQPSNYDVDYTPYGAGNRWNSGYSVYDGVNEPTTARPNVVGMFWGYNTDYQQGPIDATEAAFRFATESFFVIGVDPHFEFHLPEITTSTGDIYRLDSTYVSRTSGIGFRELVIDDFSIFSQGFNPSGGQYYLDAQYDSISDTTSVFVNSQNAGGVSKLELGNWTDGVGNCFIDFQSGGMTIACIDSIVVSSGRVAINPTEYTNLINPTVASTSFLSSPNADAIIDCQSTDQGFRVPNMTAIQRNAIATVAGLGGLLVYDSTVNGLFLWNGSAWVLL